MPKVGREKREEIVKLARQMRTDDVAWETILNDARVKGVVKNKETLIKWLEGGPSRAKRTAAKTDAAETIKELRNEIERLQALVSDLLLGKIKLGKA